MKRLSYVELDLPRCANTYGVTPCTAALTGDDKCFNSRASCQDLEHFRPGFPVVDSVTETLFAADATAHSGELPASIAAGDLLIALFANDGNATVTTPSGWSSKGTLVSGTAVRGSVFAKLALGTEDTSAMVGINLRSDGTALGDMTANVDGLGAAFDGTTSEDNNNTAAKVTATQAFIGRSFSAARKIFSATIYGGNNTGFVSSINPTMTITLRGKTGTAFNAAVATAITEGTQIGSITAFADTANEFGGPHLHHKRPSQSL